ncbi:MAG: hypothetical protein U0326_07385 [Polyangiales bacterium]
MTAAEVDALRTEATRACERESAEDAERCLAKLRALGADDEVLAGAIFTRRSTLQAKAEQRLYDGAMARYEGGDLRAALAGWSELPAPVRGRVRASSADEVFDRIERIEAPRGTDLSLVVNAALALRGLSRDRTHAAPEEVLARLGPHETWLKVISWVSAIACPSVKAVEASQVSVGSSAMASKRRSSSAERHASRRCARSARSRGCAHWASAAPRRRCAPSCATPTGSPLGPTEVTERPLDLAWRTRDHNNLATRSRLAMIGTPKALDHFDWQHPRAID